MNKNIEAGDYVKHKNPVINGGLRMTVEDVNDDSAECSHFVGAEASHKVEWFKFEDLELVQKADGGFLSM